MVAKLRTTASLLLIYLFPLFVVALFGALIWLVVWVALMNSQLGAKFVVVLIVPFIIAIIATVRQAASLRVVPARGAELGPAENPELWAELSALARAMQTSVPDRVVMTSEVNAWVRQVGKRRELGIGLPVFALLNVSEFRGVLAHEFGHFAGGETATDARVWRARRFVEIAAEQTEGFAGALFKYYYRFVVRISAASSRDLELRADTAAAKLAGGDCVANGLTKFPSMRWAWRFMLEERVPLFRDAGARASLNEGLRRTVAARREPLAQFTQDQMQAEQPAWDATHPRVLDRVAMLRALPPAVGGVDTRVAAALIGGGIDGLTLREGELLTASLPLVSWAQVTDAAMRKRLPIKMEELVLNLLPEGPATTEPSNAARHRGAESAANLRAAR